MGGGRVGPNDSVEGYLATLPEGQRAALEKLRKTILSAAGREATETISYQLPTVKVGGRSVVAYAAFREHCSLFPMSLGVIEAHRAELAPYLSGRSTLRFTPAKPLPAGVVKNIVKARPEENAARRRR